MADDTGNVELEFLRRQNERLRAEKSRLDIADQKELVAPRNDKPDIMGVMADPPSREEMKAHIDAAEARGDTKIARMEGKLDLVISKLDGVNSRIDDVRDDYRTTRANQWVIGLGLAALILGCAFGLPQIFSYGTQLRDLIHSEVQSETPKSPPAKLP